MTLIYRTERDLSWRSQQTTCDQ